MRSQHPPSERLTSGEGQAFIIGISVKIFLEIQTVKASDHNMDNFGTRSCKKAPKSNISRPTNKTTKPQNHKKGYPMNQINDMHIQELVKKLEKIFIHLNTSFIDRQDILRLGLVSMIARKNMLLLGPPGTAKSEICRQLCRAIQGRFFQRLMTKFTTENELFASGLSTCEYSRTLPEGIEKETKIRANHSGMLPEAEIVFLDEIWKSNSPVANALLSISNERIYFSQDGKEIKVPLISLFAASNEIPDSEDGLDAFLDRFDLRTYVSYLDSEQRYQLLKIKNKNTDSARPDIEPLSRGEMQQLHEYLPDIEIPDHFLQQLSNTPELLQEDELPTELQMMRPSDRRLVSACTLIRANAIFHGRCRVEEQDMREILPYMTWLAGVNHNREIHGGHLAALVRFFSGNAVSGIGLLLRRKEDADKEIKVLVNLEKSIRDDIVEKMKVNEQIDVFLERTTLCIAQLTGICREATSTLETADHLSDITRNEINRMIAELKQEVTKRQNTSFEFSKLRRQQLLKAS